MPTYVFTNKQKDLIAEALSVYYVEALEKHGIDADAVDTLIKYISEPYSGSWMGKSNIR